MARYKAILYILFTIGACITVNAGNVSFPLYSSVSEQQDKSMNLEVMINNTTKIQMENVPLSGYLEVYSILGVKVTSVNLKSYVDSKYCYLDLPKGLYILKAGKVAVKVVVK